MSTLTPKAIHSLLPTTLLEDPLHSSCSPAPAPYILHVFPSLTADVPLLMRLHTSDTNCTHRDTNASLTYGHNIHCNIKWSTVPLGTHFYTLLLPALKITSFWMMLTPKKCRLKAESQVNQIGKRRATTYLLSKYDVYQKVPKPNILFKAANFRHFCLKQLSK